MKMDQSQQQKEENTCMGAGYGRKAGIFTMRLSEISVIRKQVGEQKGFMRTIYLEPHHYFSCKHIF